MPDSDDESSAGYQFHWLPFTAAYWGVAVIVAIVAGNAWLLFAFWLANPAVLAVAWLLWVKVVPRMADKDECARRDSNP
jgi:Flp pilus assembly protein TadB